MNNIETIVILDMDEVLNSNQSIYMHWAHHLGIHVNGRKIYKHGVSKKDWDIIQKKRPLCKKLGYPTISSGEQPLDKQAVYVFNKIIEKTEAKVLVCSSWRLGRTLDELKELLYGLGLKCDIIGMTPYIWKTYPKQKLGDGWTDPPICSYPFYSGHRRGEEILYWLYNNTPKVKNIVILDDSCKGDIIQIFPDHCVIPNPYWGGLNWKNYQEAMKIIKQSIDVVEVYEDLKSNNKNLNEGYGTDT